VRRLLAVALVLSACRTVPVGVVPGATSPRGAVEHMLAAARSQDLQGISAVWGDENGLTRDRTDRAEVESRTFIIACVLKSDSQKVGEPSSAGNGRFLVPADLTQGRNSGSTRFTTVRTKEGRWLVQDVDLPALQNKGFCTR
jgi:hypothetical protein